MGDNVNRYAGDRSHGLIMGCAVVGTKPAGWMPKTRTIKSSAGTSSAPTESPWRAVLSAFMVLPRFALGAAGAMYYALLPIAIYAKNVYVVLIEYATLHHVHV